jgi:predicted DNA-binding transcriptional regulator YafY
VVLLSVLMAATVAGYADRNGPRWWRTLAGVLDTSARLLRLLALLQAQRDWTSDELARRLAVTTRTVRRDVTRLRALGYPVHAESGNGGGYRLGAGAALPPLLLDDDEVVAIVTGLRMAAAAQGDSMAESCARALAKVDRLLPAAVRHRLDALTAATVAVPSNDAAVPPRRLAALAGACRDRLRVRLGYRDHGGASTQRSVEPYRLVQAGRRWYLVAWDRDREDWRTLRVDRMREVHVTTFGFTPMQPPDPAALVSHAVTTAPYRYRARVRLHAPVPEVAEHVPAAVGVLEACGDGTCVLSTGANSLESLAVHLALLPMDAEVLEPSELREVLATMAARLHRTATTGPNR